MPTRAWGKAPSTEEARANSGLLQGESFEAILLLQKSSCHFRGSDPFDQGTEICNFGAPSPLDFFLNSLQLMFSLFSRFSVQSSKAFVPKCGENCPISRRRKKRRILLRL